MKRQRGFSLAELIVYCFIFSLVLGVLLHTFVKAARSFQQLVARQGVQSELRRISALLRRDVTLSDYRSVGASTRTQDGVERDALGFTGVDAWTKRSNFDNYLKPRWNIYVLYYGTTADSETVAPAPPKGLGQLIRKEVAQSIPYPIPMEVPMVESMSATPTIGQGYKLLTRNLVEFSVLLDQTLENVRVHLSLRSDAGLTNDGLQRESEIIECYIDMRPENTYPPR